MRSGSGVNFILFLVDSSRIDFMFSPSALAALLALQSSGPTVTVHFDQPGHGISPTFFGLMTEEINHSYDGGLYGELVQNRDLRDNAEKPLHWSLVQDEGAGGSLSLAKEGVPGTALDTSLVLSIQDHFTHGRVGVANDGYWGIPIYPRTRYRASFYAKASGFIGSVTVSLESTDGKKIFAAANVPVSSTWRKHEVSLSTLAETPTKDARLVISTKGIGSLHLTQVSLFPPTFHGRPNGNRVDLMQKLVDMKPSFLRFPGGNYLEGNSIKERFDWKKTVGKIEDRPGHQGPWGYRSSDGMGILEFLEWCEDMKAQPLLAVFAAYTMDRQRVTSGPLFESYVQDALDEIEYVTGGPSTKWGAQRVRDGHAKPFPLTYVEIGNEDWNGTDYDQRFAGFFDAIRAKYPKLKLIATNNVKSRKPDLVDDHYYRPGTEMMSDAGHYDGTDRSGHKTFVGEWASTDNKPWEVVPANSTPTFHEALGDAAWLTGLERDSDQVLMECYAPLLSNVNPKATQWGVNLIGYDALSSYGSPSYYVQTMFSHYTGTETVPVTIGSESSKKLFIAASRTGKDLYLKIVNAGADAAEVALDFDGIKRLGSIAEGLTMAGELNGKNSLEDPLKISPKPLRITGIGKQFSYSFPAYSIAVLKVRLAVD